MPYSASYCIEMHPQQPQPPLPSIPGTPSSPHPDSPAHFFLLSKG